MSVIEALSGGAKALIPQTATLTPYSSTIIISFKAIVFSIKAIISYSKTKKKSRQAIHKCTLANASSTKAINTRKKKFGNFIQTFNKFTVAFIYLTTSKLFFMNKRDEAKVSMYKAVEAHCTANQKIIATSVAFLASFTFFGLKLAALLTNESSAQQQTKGVALDKGALKAILIQAAYDIASVVFAYANKVKNETLKQSVNFSITDLERLKDEFIVPVCTNIKAAATAHLAALADYSVTAENLTDLQTHMDNYSGATPNPRLAKTQKTTDNKNVKALMKEIDDILKNEMDKTVVIFRAANPNFVTKYTEVRKIVDPGTISKADKTKTDTPK